MWYSSCSNSGPSGRGALGKEHPATLAEEVVPHTAVMLKEVLHCLNIQPGQVSFSSFTTFISFLKMMVADSLGKSAVYRYRVQINQARCGILSQIP